MIAHPLPKPRVRPIGPAAYRVNFGTGSATIRHCMEGRDRTWSYEVGDNVPLQAYSAEQALAASWMACIEAPAPLAMTRETIAALISGAQDATACAKLMRRLLKLRTGIAWSVTGGRGTARSWLRIHVPKARKVNSNGQPTDEDWGYMSSRDRALLGAILGELPHQSPATKRRPTSWSRNRVGTDR